MTESNPDRWGHGIDDPGMALDVAARDRLAFLDQVHGVDAVQSSNEVISWWQSAQRHFFKVSDSKWALHEAEVQSGIAQESGADRKGQGVAVNQARDAADARAVAVHQGEGTSQLLFRCLSDRIDVMRSTSNRR